MLILKVFFCFLFINRIKIVALFLITYGKIFNFFLSILFLIIMQNGICKLSQIDCIVLYNTASCKVLCLTRSHIHIFGLQKLDGNFALPLNSIFPVKFLKSLHISTVAAFCFFFFYYICMHNHACFCVKKKVFCFVFLCGLFHLS